MRQVTSLSLCFALLSSSCSSEKGSSNKESNPINPVPTLIDSNSNSQEPNTAAADTGTSATEAAPPIAQTPIDKGIGPIALDFAAKVHGEELKCYDKSPEMLAADQIFTDVRIFVSNVVLVNDADEEVKVTLDQVAESANLQFTDAKGNAFSLLNFLDASCAVSDATKTLKHSINGTIPYGHYKSLKFQLGLPYAANDEVNLTKVPAALAPTDMAWMWQHFPAEFQIESHNGKSKAIVNALVSPSTEKPSISLALDYTHGKDSLGPKIALELSRLFVTTGDAFLKGLESACTNSTKKMTEASPNCAHAFKALGLEVESPKEAYEQTVFSIIP